MRSLDGPQITSKLASVMNREEASRVCDELHEYVDQGLGENPADLEMALGTVRMLRAAASWDDPLAILLEVEVQLARWFSPAEWGGSDERLHCHETLLDQVPRLGDAWERPCTKAWRNPHARRSRATLSISGSDQRHRMDARVRQWQLGCSERYASRRQATRTGTRCSSYRDAVTSRSAANQSSHSWPGAKLRCCALK